MVSEDKVRRMARARVRRVGRTEGRCVDVKRGERMEGEASIYCRMRKHARLEGTGPGVGPMGHVQDDHERRNPIACTNVERTNAKVHFSCTDVKHRSEEDEWNADNQSNERRCRCALQPSTNGVPPANACLVDTRFHCSRHQSSSSDRSNTFPFLDFFRAISSSSS